jgi:SAM-dependent methyltransferase
MSGAVEREWNGHQGVVVASANGFDVIECRKCGFKHIVSIPTEQELERAYRHEYYTQEKPLYLDRYRQDLDWWNTVYTHRYEILEQYLPPSRRKILDIGSGPGFFLLNGQKRGWQVKGVEPSEQAAQHSVNLGLDVENIFFSEQTAPALGQFDAINMGEVLEHIPQPAALLQLAHTRLSEGGVVCLVVPNDFNPFQMTLRDHLGFAPWWIAPPHHINYFNFTSLSGLVEKCGFEVLHQESTFPIDMFLLMGDNYIGNDKVGRECHTKRMTFEKALVKGSMGNLLGDMYAKFSELGIGREIVLFAKKVARGNSAVHGQTA